MFGFPHDINAWIMKLHRNYSVVLKVGIIKKLTSHGCGVKQGEILAPTLFMMVMQLATQDLESEFKNNNVTMLKALVSSKIENAIRRKKEQQHEKHVTNNNTNSTVHRRRCYPI